MYLAFMHFVLCILLLYIYALCLMQPNAFTSGTCPSYKATVSFAWTESTEKDAKRTGTVHLS